ncbi:ABC transporter ATP-binding protein [Rhizobium sp. FY34]|uniref:ABC transporter ATP-binding protein n=1 Tax=Rhizobium sp. FY34 TaxID=2562309 RepID=UPI0019819FC2|nr:ABC transporter ATP-binding protein [Rhizobium sp. FY34]
MKISIHHSCLDFESYRAARVKSLFNVEDGSGFDITVDLPVEDTPWKIGLVVGPSGSGKTSLGRRVFQTDRMARVDWPEDRPIIDAIAPDRDFNDATTALASVGLGSVPAWLRPYHVLSNGEKFRADLARIVCDQPEEIVIDEFTSVVDRQIAKAWRRTEGRAVLLSCHYDIVDWLDPDWVYDTATGEFTGRCHRQRPKITVEIRQTNWQWWRYFEPHHYLKLPHMIAATCYVAFVDGEPVAHVAFSTRPGMVEARACRLVVMPECRRGRWYAVFECGLCGMAAWPKPLRNTHADIVPHITSRSRDGPAPRPKMDASFQRSLRRQQGEECQVRGHEIRLWRTFPRRPGLPLY